MGHSNGSDLNTIVVRSTTTMVILSNGAVAHTTIWRVSWWVSIGYRLGIDEAIDCRATYHMENLGTNAAAILRCHNRRSSLIVSLSGVLSLFMRSGQI